MPTAPTRRSFRDWLSCAAAVVFSVRTVFTLGVAAPLVIVVGGAVLVVADQHERAHESQVAAGSGYTVVDWGHTDGARVLRAGDGHLVRVRFIDGEFVTALNGSGALTPVLPSRS